MKRFNSNAGRKMQEAWCQKLKENTLICIDLKGNTNCSLLDNVNESRLKEILLLRKS